MSSVSNVPHTPPTANDALPHPTTDTYHPEINNTADHNNPLIRVNKPPPQHTLSLIWPPKTRSSVDQNKPTAAFTVMQPNTANGANTGRPPGAVGTGGGGGRGADVVPSAQPNLHGTANPETVMNANTSNLLPPLSSMGAAKNPVKAAFRLVQQSWSRVNTVNACDARDKPKTFRFRYLDVIGNGTFGIVCKAKDLDTDETVAIKTVFQDQHHQNRELYIIKSLQHECIVGLKSYFYTRNEYKEEFLSLVLEYMPLSLDKLDAQQRTDSLLRRVMSNFLQAVDYLHARGVCHRDIKPHNVLIDPNTGKAKVCDFGCSKRLIAGEPNIQYICARYYRAPEIAFGWPHYSLSIDVWSVGCVMAELYTGRPLFPGKNSVDQLAKIVKVLGGPDGLELAAMGQDPRRFRHVPHADQQARRLGLRAAVGPQVPDDAIDLMFGLLQYDPTRRLSAAAALQHPYFRM